MDLPVSGATATSLITDGRKGDYHQTYSGVRFYTLDPRPEEVQLIDIAHALSQICRFGGHSIHFYSVAQHCLHVSELVEEETCSKELALLGLLHDSAEAYIGDIISPIKRHMPEMRAAEHRVFDVIMQRFALLYRSGSLPASIHKADMISLMTEKRDVIYDHGIVWREKAEADRKRNLVYRDPQEIERAYIRRFWDLGGHIV